MFHRNKSPQNIDIFLKHSVCTLRYHCVELTTYQRLKPENAEENLENAFSVAEEELGIPRLLDVEDFILDELDEKSIMTYLSAFNRMYSKVWSHFLANLWCR